MRDLKQRGLLDTTLIIWGGEFGRTPINEVRGGSHMMGRAHRPRAFTAWMAGAGVKSGLTVGRPTTSATTSSKIHGRPPRYLRLTDVSGEVAQELLA